MNYWCEHCLTVYIEEDVRIIRIDESFTAPYGNVIEKHERYSEEVLCPDCGRELEEHDGE